MNKETGGPAFPQDYEHTRVIARVAQDGKLNPDEVIEVSRQLAGMTLRDYFAAKAMQALAERMGMYPVEQLADEAYAMADAMLKARKA